MNTQRIFAIVKKDLKKTIREPAALFLVILFPLVLTLVFGVSMGGIGGNTTQSYDIGVVNHNAGGRFPNWSLSFIENLTLNPILKVHHYDGGQAAQDDLSQGKLSAVLTIPENFGESCESFRSDPTNRSRWIPATVGLSVDEGSMVATQAIAPIVQQTLAKTIIGQQASLASLPVTVGNASLVDAEKKSVFFYMVPGLFAYGAIFIIMIVGQSFTVERDEGLLRRLNTTPLTSSEFMTSQILSNMALVIVQVAVVFVVAFAVGYAPDTDAAGLAMAFFIVSIFSLCCVGFGLITATIARSPGAATGLSFIFILPMMFFGTFVSNAAPSSLSAAIGAYIPSHYVTDALTSLFSREAPISSASVLTDLSMISAISIGVLLVGILLFKRYGKR